MNKSKIKANNYLFVSPMPHSDYKVTLNWPLEWPSATPKDMFESFASSYHYAGKVLLQNYGDDVILRDFGAYPVVFLYRHALELALKGFALAGDDLLITKTGKGIDRDAIMRTHSLVKIFEDVDRMIGMLGWGYNFDGSGPKTKIEFIEIVKEFDKFDKGSYTFRYPYNKHTQMELPSRFVFDLRTFCKKLDPIIEDICAGTTGVTEAFQADCEAMD